MENYYVLEIRGKNLYRFIKYLYNQKINILNIKYDKDKVYITVGYKDYLNVLNIKTSYQIRLVNIKGAKKISFIFLNNKLFYTCFLFSVLVIIFCSNIIFKISYDNVPVSLVPIIREELNNYGLTKYSFKKSYKDIEMIKKEIKRNNNESIEWIEIEEKGVTYNIKVIKRIIDKEKPNKEPCDIVAKKNGFIISILSSSGEVLKNPGDYVSKGEVIVSGIIKNKEDIVDIKASEADVYAETWYKVKISHPFTYLKEENSNKYKNFYYLNFLGKRINLYRKNTNSSFVNSYDVINNIIFKFTKEKRVLISKKEIKYSEEELEEKINEIARNKIIETIGPNDEILLQKTLKKEVENDRINMEVFFKVKENIKQERKIELKEGKV